MKFDDSIVYGRLVAQCDDVTHTYENASLEKDHWLPVLVGALLGMRLMVEYPDLMKRWFQDFIKESPPHAGLLDAQFVATGIPETEEVKRGHLN